MTHDQQGRYYFEKRDYKKAAEPFDDPLWRGFAAARAGDGEAALNAFALSDTAEAWYNQGDVLAHLGKYPEAVAAYRQALARRSPWPEAQENLELVQSLIPKAKKDNKDNQQQEIAPDLPPDQIKFRRETQRRKKDVPHQGRSRIDGGYMDAQHPDDAGGFPQETFRHPGHGRPQRSGAQTMRPLAVKLLLALCSQPAVSQAPVVRAHLEPAGNILVGRPVRLVVSDFVRNCFTGGADFPEFEIENAIVVLPQDRPENSNTQINGVSYAGITETYVIYPQQAGDFHVPPAQVTVPYAIAPPKSTTAHPSLPALTFHANVPAAAKDLPYFLPTTSLTMTQKWSRPLKGLRAGDTIVRTITVTATRMQAMLIPPLPLDQPDGIRIYPTESILHDQKTDRGDFIDGQRIESAKYLLQKAGDYTLPPITLQW